MLIAFTKFNVDSQPKMLMGRLYDPIRAEDRR